MSTNPVDPKARPGGQPSHKRTGDPDGVEERGQDRTDGQSTGPKRRGTQNEDSPAGETAPTDISNEEAGPTGGGPADEDSTSQPGRQREAGAPRPGTLGSDENTGGFSQREAPEEKAY